MDAETSAGHCGWWRYVAKYSLNNGHNAKEGTSEGGGDLPQMFYK